MATATRTTTEHSIHYAACSLGVDYFVHHFCLIDEPQGEIVTILPFHLWPAQKKLLYRFLQHRQHIILKARQLGISWLVCAYALWLCLFQPGRNVILFSKGQFEADELLRRITVMYHRLPDWMRTTNPLLKENNGELRFTNGSAIVSMPATKNAGRSLTATLVIVDEFAFLLWPQQLYTALKPTIDNGGQLILLSTANGESGLFYDLWKLAVERKSTLIPSFLSWKARPGRTQAWRDAIASDATLSSLVDQEYPEQPDDAFCNTGSERYLPSILLWDACKETLPPLDRRTRLVLGVDGAVGRSTGPSDYFAICGVSAHPQDRKKQAVRFIKAWQAKPGQKLDADMIRAWLRWLWNTYAIQEITYDPARLEFLMQDLGKPGTYPADPDNLRSEQRKSGGLYCTEFSQNNLRILADGALLDRIADRSIVWDERIDGAALLREHLSNSDRRVDTSGEARKIRIVKRSESLKIDLSVSLAMCSYRAAQLFG